MNHVWKKLIWYSVSICMLFIQTGCWSSEEIEDMGVYVALGIDVAEQTEFEKVVNAHGGHYPKQNNITATVQIVPENSSKSNTQESSPSAGK